MAYRNLNSYLKETFSRKVYKIGLSTPFTCPNRDGKVGVGGCIFCSASGSGNFAASASLPVSLQLEEAKRKVGKKIKDENPGFIAYFQSFSSTYGSIEVQRELFFAAIQDPLVVALSIATRPDCLEEEVLDLLEELNGIKPVWVELGLQTAKEESVKLIRRGYDNLVYLQAVKSLNKRGIKVITHLILGLPGETHEDEIATLAFAQSVPIFGLKFHLLHVLAGTDLAKMDYTPLTLEEYVFRVTDLLRYVDPSIVIHRLTGDGDKRELLAPLWSGDKKKVLNAIAKRIREEEICQGEIFLKKI